MKSKEISKSRTFHRFCYTLNVALPVGYFSLNDLPLSLSVNTCWLDLYRWRWQWGGTMGYKKLQEKYQGIFKQCLMDHVNVLSWLAGMSKLRWKEIHIVYPGRAGVWKQWIEKMAEGNLKLSDNIRCHRSVLTTLIQAMVCCLMVKPFPESMLTYHKQEALWERKYLPCLVWGAWDSVVVRCETIQPMVFCDISSKFHKNPFTLCN